MPLLMGEKPCGNLRKKRVGSLGEFWGQEPLPPTQARLFVSVAARAAGQKPWCHCPSRLGDTLKDEHVTACWRNFWSYTGSPREDTGREEWVPLPCLLGTMVGEGKACWQ